MKSCYIVFVFVCLVSCDSSSGGISEDIAQHFQSSGRTFVNLEEVVSSPWDRVCILGPYSDNNSAKVTLGFNWETEAHTSIKTNDSIVLLLFVQGNKVVKFVEHSRVNGDFANLSRQCFQREKSLFIHQSNPPKGWPGLFLKE